jgi:rhodanese-related sulfurtransferase
MQQQNKFGVIAAVILFVLIIAGGIAMYSSSNNSVSRSGQTSMDSADNTGVTPKITKINAEKFAGEIEEDGAVILDIRTPGEFAGGRIAGAINIDFYTRAFEQELEKLDKSGNYKIYCNSGNRSSDALEIMEGMGFTKVSELAGGIQAWNFAGKPTCTSC